MIHCVIFYSLLFLVVGCGAANTETCTTSTGTPTDRPDTQYNGQCAPGEVLIGYSPNAIGGPLICATLTTNCPLPAKSAVSPAGSPLLSDAHNQ